MTRSHKMLIGGVLALLSLGCSLMTDWISSGASGAQIGQSPAATLLTAGQIQSVPLSSILLQDGDLPAAFGHGNPTSAVPERFKDFPAAQAQISIEFTQGGSWAGDASVFLYADAADIEKAFNPKGDAYDESQALAGLGEKSNVLVYAIPYGTAGETLDGVNVLWTRCSAVAEIRLVTSNPEVGKDYARALDARLAAAACAGGAAVAPAEAPQPETVQAPPVNSDCPYAGDSDLATLTNLINAEAEAIIAEDMDIIRKIFAPNAFFSYADGQQTWNTAEARYRELFDTATIRNPRHFGIAPTGEGITAMKAWMISGSSGTYIPNGGDPVDYYNEPGKDTWVMIRNFYGCWVISEFRFY